MEMICYRKRHTKCFTSSANVVTNVTEVIAWVYALAVRSRQKLRPYLMKYQLIAGTEF